MKNIKYILIIWISLGLTASALAAGSSVQIEGALPSPNANLYQFTLTPGTVAAGDTCTQAGKIGLDDANNLWVCDGSIYSPMGSVWTENGTTIFPTDTAINHILVGSTDITQNDQMLTMVNGGGIVAATGAMDTAPTLTTAGAGARFIWYPLKAAFRAGFVDGTQWNDANIGNFSVALGRSNKAATEDSTIGGGYNNTINTAGGTSFDGYAVIGGGRNNASSSNDTVIGGGNTNSISTGAQYGVVSGGFTNVINTNVTGGTISGGWNNTVSGAGDTISGGYQNSVNGSLVGGASVIAGGYSNTILPGPSNMSVIGGGTTNSITGPYNTIAGGNSNSISSGSLSGWGTIGGGLSNTISNTTPLRSYSTIAGGRQNTLSDTQHSFIGGGLQNSASADSASILGGTTNTTSGVYSAIAGGLSNSVNASGWGAFIGGGTLNQANFSGTVIGGGESNTASGQYSVIGGGFQNTASGFAASIPGGVSNTASGNYSTVLGGGSNGVTNAYSVVGGYNLNNTGQHSFLWGYNPPGPVFPWNINDSALFYISGNFGIGQGAYASNPAYKLAVDGTLGVNGNITSTGTITATLGKVSGTPGAVQAWYSTISKQIGYDVAENFDAKEEVEIADLVEVSDDPGVQMQKTQTPYSKRVVGVVSTAPAILFEGNELQIAPKPGEFVKGKKPPVALAGRVPVKVSNENGAIERGDLLVSSSMPGHAMKATDHDKMMGAVVGKALEPFTAGKDGEKTGMILMMVNLQ